MPRVLKLALGVSVGLLLFGPDLHGLPWSTDMVRGPARPTAAGPRGPARGAIPVDGELSLERWQIERLARQPAAGVPVAAGRALYLTYCAPCHGPRGLGDGPVAKLFIPPTDLTSERVRTMTDGWLYATMRSGAMSMPRYGHEMSRAERWALVAYLRTLSHD